MTRPLALIALGLVSLTLIRPAAATEPGIPLPWDTFTDAARAASDRQPFRCLTGEEGSDQSGNPDHIWFGTSPARGSAALIVARDEPFDQARHGSPCSGWLLGTPGQESRGRKR